MLCWRRLKGLRTTGAMESTNARTGVLAVVTRVMGMAAGMAAILALASPACVRADVAVIRSAAPVQEAQADDAARNAAGALRRVGVSYRILRESAFSEAGLRQFDVVVLPYNRLSEAQAETLRKFSARGGRWVAFATHPATPSPAFDELLGVRAAPSVPGFAPKALLPAPRSGIPARVPVPASTIHRPCVPADPALAAGQWEGGGALASLVRGPHGYFVNMLPGQETPHAELLLALLGEVDPSLWLEAQESIRARAVSSIQRTADRWSRLRTLPEVTRDQRARLDASVQTLRNHISPVEPLSPEIDADRAVIGSRVRVMLQAIDESERLSFRITPSRKGEVRGGYLAPSARPDWDAVMRRLREAGLNTVVLQVGRGGSVIYPGAPLPQDAWAKGNADELKAAIEAGRRHSLSIHAARLMFDVSTAAADQTQRLRADDRLVRDLEGKQGTVLSPADPRNQEQEVQVLLDLARRYDLDGIHLEGLQYPGQPHGDWDYGPVSRREFEKAVRKPVEHWPDDVLSGPRQAEFNDWQRDVLNRLAQRLFVELKKARPGLTLSAAVARDHRRARALLKQDWPTWVSRGWLDMVVTRDSGADGSRFLGDLDAQVAAAAGRTVLVPYLGVAPVGEADTLLRQVEAAREAGADGFLVSSAGPGADAMLVALRAGATAEGTWPAFQAPGTGWTVRGGVERRDLPIAFTYGDKGDLQVRIVRDETARSGVKSITGLLRLEDLSGRFVTALDTVNGWVERRVAFEVPAGRFRPVLRGVIGFQDGTVRPFVVRGPVCEGLSSEEIASLQSQESPPTAMGSGRRVGVFRSGASGDRLIQTLRGRQGVAPVSLYRLLATHLAVTETLILPGDTDLEDLTPTVAQALRQWVIGGGTMILLGDAAGASWYPRLFPEAGRTTLAGSGDELVAARQLGAFIPSRVLSISGRERTGIAPGQGAEVLLREAGEGGAAVAVRGKVGKGVVVLSGLALGKDGQELTEDERELLLALISGEGVP